VADLGGIGEATLLAWAHEVGISPNKANHDVKGWDFLLVLPKGGADVVAVSPLDLEPPELTCLVQVKTTRDASKSIGVKLSNWQRLATSPLPTFFLVLEVNSANKPHRAFLVHVGEEWIARVLKRLRQAKPNERDNLHRRSLALALKAGETLPSLDGHALLGALRVSIGANAYDYFSIKRRWLDTVGYEHGRFDVRLTFGSAASDDLYETMADFAIGRLKRMPLKRYRVRDIRFGVPTSVKDVQSPQEMFLELPEIPPRMDVTLEASDDKGIEVVSIDCKAYPATTLFPFLPPKYRKVALKADGVTLLVTPAESDSEAPQGSFSLHLPEPGDARPLGAVVATAKLARLCVFRPHLGARSDVTWARIPAARGHGFRRTWAAIPMHLGTDSGAPGQRA